MHKVVQHWPPGLHCAILGGSALLALVITQFSLLVCMSLLTKTAHCVVLVLNRLGWTMHYIVPIVSQPPDSSVCALHSFGNESPIFLVEILRSS